MDTRQMDLLIEIRKTLNFNRAAEALGTSQPSVSYQVRNIEKEAGFQIFERSGKSVSLTPAGEQFVISITAIRDDIRRAVEQGQNISGHVASDIRIGLPTRSALKVLPDVIRRFAAEFPDISVTPVFHAYGDFDNLLTGRTDLEFAATGDLGRIRGVREVHLYDVPIYLIVKDDDFLADRSLVSAEDIRGRTLMVGGGSPPLLKTVQQRTLSSGDIQYFNSNDHDTTLVNVAAGKGVCLSPGFLNGDDPGFRWVPFDCTERFECALMLREDEDREPVLRLSEMLREAYVKQCARSDH